MGVSSTFSFPTAVYFGSGAIAELPARLRAAGMNRPLVVTDPGLLGAPAFAQLEAALGASQKGRSWFLDASVHANPVEADALHAAEEFRAHECDSVVACGGGSAMDAGKAARLLIKRPNLDLARYDFNDDWSALAPLVCIPTTAGTGSEVGRSAVITLAAPKRKAVLFHPNLLARFVILDPELTRALPPGLTAATGLDAFTHCVESFTAPQFHPLCDGVALEGIYRITRFLPVAFANGNDIEARGEMLAAAAMGAVAFQKDLGAAHSMAHPLSALFGVHHGAANAVCLPAVMRFNAARKPGLYRRVGLACGLDLFSSSDADADRRTIDFVQRLIAQLGLHRPLRDFGVSAAGLDELSDQAMADGCHRTNPAPVTRADFKALFQEVL